jgi:D-arabinose 1-dehydrogenase-like Zn-dependent alcohol dehydrogenase
MPSFQVFTGSESGSIKTSTTTRSLDPHSVLVRITHSGLCGTDVHYLQSTQALGHEGVGIVESVGPAVTLHKPGDRVGWGYNHSCCGACTQCLRGMDTFCPQRKLYGMADLDQGSMGQKAVWEEGFLFKIPDTMGMSEAAPLMCGGATVYGAMRRGGVKGTDRVGVVGVGGLGHLAVQFAAKMGCEVVVFSGSEGKKEEALRLGAREFWAMKGREKGEVEKTEGWKRLDHLLVTSSELPDWEVYMPLLSPEARIYPLTVSQDKLEIPSLPLILSGLAVQGSLVADRGTHREMLDFAARHGIRPIVEECEVCEKGIGKAFEKLNAGKMKYRGVLVAN